jgi:hypothetical protein
VSPDACLQGFFFPGHPKRISENKVNYLENAAFSAYVKKPGTFDSAKLEIGSYGAEGRKGEPDMRTKKEIYIDKMAKRLKEWSEDIDEFEGRASRTEVGFLEDYGERLRNLKEKRDLLSSRLKDLKESSSDSWTTLKTGVENAKHDLRDAFAAAREEFRKVA